MAVLKPSGQEVMNVASLAHSTTTALSDCTPPVTLTRCTQLCFTVVCTFNASATGDAQLTLWPSYDGTNFDTVAWGGGWYDTIVCVAGTTVTHTTLAISPVPKAMKVKIANSDTTYAITNLKVYAVVQTAG